MGGQNRESHKKGDWYGIGTYAGKQINKGINAVPWKKQEKQLQQSSVKH